MISYSSPKLKNNFWLQLSSFLELSMQKLPMASGKLVVQWWSHCIGWWCIVIFAVMIWACAEDGKHFHAKLHVAFFQIKVELSTSCANNQTWTELVFIVTLKNLVKMQLGFIIQILIGLANQQEMENGYKDINKRISWLWQFPTKFAKHELLRLLSTHYHYVLNIHTIPSSNYTCTLVHVQVQ